ncbi:aldo/keto reductase, partial [Streptomyces asiaticus]
APRPSGGGVAPARGGGTAAAAGLPPLPGATLEAVGHLYDRRIRAQVHHRW